jgi:hypothetical protein
MVTHARVEIGRLKKKVGGMKQVVWCYIEQGSNNS